ncbi:kinase phosphorylation protein-domain-containing protein [Blakeslea trispora]|nr:kinase phosphorylation protein-domain-containing protein [Blakeslea trispora]
MFHPTRGGTRGGRDQFSWEDVKNDKHRENYLGHSLMAPVGRWQKGKDLTWYAKNSKEDEIKAKQSELAKIKEAEAEAMAIALGVRKKKTLESNVTEEDLKHALNKDIDESDSDSHLQGETEKGLGYGRSSNRFLGMAEDRSMEVMNGSHAYSTASIPQQPHDNTVTDKQEEGIKRKSKKEHKHKKEKKHHRDRSPDRRHRHHRDSRPRSRSPRKRREEGRRRHDSSREGRGRRDDSREARRDSRERTRYSRRGDSRGRSSKREAETRHSKKRSPSPERRSLSPYSKRVLLSQNQ